MNSTKMVADSTQSELTADKSKKRRKETPGDKKEKKRLKKTFVKKKDKKKTKGAESDQDSDLNLEKVVQPIAFYIKDREEMINQMFRSVQGDKLRSMIPDILKTLPMDELKKLCLGHLEVMSKKRIRRILDGADPGIISSSGTEEDSTDEEKEEEKKEALQPGSQVADSTSQSSADLNNALAVEKESKETEGAVNFEDEEADDVDDEEGKGANTEDEDSDHDADVSSNHSNHTEAEEHGGDENEDEGNMDMADVNVSNRDNVVDDEDVDNVDINEGNEGQQSKDDKDEEQLGQEEERIEEKEENNEEEEDEDEEGEDEDMDLVEFTKDNPEGDVSLSHTQMEILELEMRARAIKAMLRAQEIKEQRKKLKKKPE